MLMAGLDGIKNKIEPPEPIDKDLYELPPDEACRSRRCPARWRRCSTTWRPTTTTCSRAACSPPDLIETWIEYKRDHEIDPIRLRPHPHEFEMYYDC